MDIAETKERQSEVASRCGSGKQYTELVASYQDPSRERDTVIYTLINVTLVTDITGNITLFNPVTATIIPD